METIIIKKKKGKRFGIFVSAPESTREEGRVQVPVPARDQLPFAEKAKGWIQLMAAKSN